MLESNQIHIYWLLVPDTGYRPVFGPCRFFLAMIRNDGHIYLLSTTSNLAHMCFLPCLRNRDSGGIYVAHHLRLSQNSSAVTLKHGRVEASFLAGFSPQPQAALTLIERRDQIE